MCVDIGGGDGDDAVTHNRSVDAEGVSLVTLQARLEIIFVVRSTSQSELMAAVTAECQYTMRCKGLFSSWLMS